MNELIPCPFCNHPESRLDPSAFLAFAVQVNREAQKLLKAKEEADV